MVKISSVVCLQRTRGESMGESTSIMEEPLCLLHAHSSITQIHPEINNALTILAALILLEPIEDNRRVPSSNIVSFDATQANEGVTVAFDFVQAFIVGVVWLCR